MGNQTHAITSQVERITPRVAQALLGKAAPNRAFSEKHCTKLQSAMERGQWTIGEPLMLDERGRLFEGQHRLTALIRAKMTLDFVVIRGAPSTVHINTGKPRSAAGVLSMYGVKNYNLMAAVTKVILAMEAGERSWPTSQGGTATNDDIVERATSDKTIKAAVTLVSGKYRRATAIATPSFLGWFLYCALKGLADFEDCADFMLVVCGEVVGKTGHPAVLLHKILTDPVRQRRVVPEEKAAYFVKAWNAYRQNREIKFLRYAKWAARGAEEFPELDLDRFVEAAQNGQMS